MIITMNGLMNKILHRRQRQENLDSSAIRALEYDPGRRSLIIDFANGRRYQYGCVERHTYRMISSAPSVGKFFNAYIRDNYPYRQLDTGE